MRPHFQASGGPAACTAVFKSTRCGQYGGALVELLVVATACVPLVIGLPLLSKYLDIFQVSEEAAHLAAFEATVHNPAAGGWKSDADLTADISAWSFANASAPILSVGAPGRAPTRPVLWNDSKGRTLLATDGTGVAVTTSIVSTNPIVATAVQRSDLGLSIDNFVTGVLHLTLANVPNAAPFDHLDLTSSRRYAVLVDPWTARNPDQVREAIEHAPTTYPIELISPVVDLLCQIPRVLLDPGCKLGDHDWDVVPADRLAPQE